MVGPLYVRIWRVLKIFGMRNLKVKLIPDRDLYKRLLSLLVPDVIMVIAMFMLQTIEAKPVLSSESWAWSNTCAAQGETNLVLFMIVYKVCLFLYGFKQAFELRNNVKVEAFNESQALGIAVYNLTVWRLL